TADARRVRRERGLALGTPYYMAPEQVRGKEDIDGRADLYSLGATLYHMVTGRRLFLSTNVDEVLRAQLEDEPMPANSVNRALSSGFGEVLETLLAKDRRRRYQSAADLILDLECLGRGEPPRLIRRGVAAGVLGALASGDADEDEIIDAEVEKEDEEEE